MQTTLANQSLTLLPQRAIHWPAERTLIVADIHLGKASTFRAKGVPLPPSICSDMATRDLARLSALIAAHPTDHLVILGDLLHAKEAHDPRVLSAFAQWRAAHPPAALRITLIRGNHDHRAGDPPADWSIDTVDQGTPLGPFLLAHYPTFTPATPRPDLYTLAGHLHPAIRLEGHGMSERCPCFWFSARVGIVPSFGSFTGGATIAPAAGDQVFVVGPDRVVALPVPGAPKVNLRTGVTATSPIARVR